MAAATAATVTLQIVNPPAVLGKRARGLDTMEVDYSKPLAYPPSAEVVEAMSLRILQVPCHFVLWLWHRPC